MSAIPFTCGCGRAVPDLETWQRDWTYAYHDCYPSQYGYPAEHWEARNCVCGSTKMIPDLRNPHPGRCTIPDKESTP